MRALKRKIIKFCVKGFTVTTQAREGIETAPLGSGFPSFVVTTQAREGIETPFVQRSLSRSTRVQRVTAQRNLSRE